MAQHGLASQIAAIAPAPATSPWRPASPARRMPHTRRSSELDRQRVHGPRRQHRLLHQAMVEIERVHQQPARTHDRGGHAGDEGDRQEPRQAHLNERGRAPMRLCQAVLIRNSARARSGATACRMGLNSHAPSSAPDTDAREDTGTTRQSIHCQSRIMRAGLASALVMVHHRRYRLAVQYKGNRRDDQHAAATGCQRADHPAYETRGEQREVGRVGCHVPISGPACPRALILIKAGYQRIWGSSVTTTPEFAFIVVGAGSAGSGLSDSPAADGPTTPLSMEAGGEDHDAWIHIPGWFLCTTSITPRWRGTVSKIRAGARKPTIAACL